jgi:hypothetical protein
MADLAPLGRGGAGPATTRSEPVRRLPASLQDAFAAIASALQLRPDAFAGLGAGAVPEGPGLWIALAAGFSQAIGQAFILFVNRVRPLRFALSLLLEALLFAIGFLFWAASTWLVAGLAFGVAEPLPLVIRALGIAHAPQLLAFAGALPYLGAPWLRLLSLWTALAFEVGFVAVTGLSGPQAFVCLVGGWLGMHAVQRTAGQPLVALGRSLQNRAAGVPLQRGRDLETLLRAGPRVPGARR